MFTMPNAIVMSWKNSASFCIVQCIGDLSNQWYDEYRGEEVEEEVQVRGLSEDIESG